VRTRVATQLDEAAALDVVRADGEATGRQPSKATLAGLRSVLRSPTALTLVADDDGAVVGLLVAELRGRELQLSLLCVAPEHRRRGAGRALVGALLERYPDVTAATDEPGARALLERERAFRGGSRSR
jgi:ribosomal protein S18 acetylase RimI-like enzyme